MSNSERPPYALGYLGIGATNIAAWADFATDILGAGATHDDRRLLLRTDEADHRIAISPSDEDALEYVGWETADAGHLAQLRSNIENAGIQVHEGTEVECVERRVQSMAWCLDPAGIRQEFFWGRATTVSSPFRSAAGVSRFIDGLGHYVLYTDRAEATREFFLNSLGFSVSDFRGSAWFLRCNHRHHSVALVASDQTRIHHFMLEVAELDDVGRALDRSISNGSRSRSLGRHSNDLTVSFYLRSPSGFEIEYGYDSIRMGQDPVPIREIDSGDSWGHAILDRSS